MFAITVKNKENSLNPTKMINIVIVNMVKNGEAYILSGFPSCNLLFSFNLLLPFSFFGFFLLHESIVGVRVPFL